MKRTSSLLAVIALSFLMLASTQAQALKWSYISAIPSQFTNDFFSVSSIGDAAGASAWLLQGSFSIFPGIPGPVQFQRIIWLNKSGTPVLTNDIPVGTDFVTATLVRLSRNELVVQLKGIINLTNNVNVLRHFTVAHGDVRETDTELLTTEIVSGIGTTSSLLATDKTGFFTYTLGVPAVPEFVVRRYAR
jgi:hypothetical protein